MSVTYRRNWRYNPTSPSSQMGWYL